MQPWRGYLATALAAALSLIGVAGGPAAAQNVTRTRVGIGYVAEAPDLMAGAGVYVIFPALGGLGVYVDGKLDASSPARKSNFDPTLTAQQVEDQPAYKFDNISTDSWRAFDVALIRPLRPGFSVYAGAGYAGKKRYNEYNDTTGTRGLVGHFWVEDPSRRSSTVNFMGGVMLRMSRFLNAQMGVESAPGGFTVGLALLLPPQ